MKLKTIQYFNQFIDSFKRMVRAKVLKVFQYGNQKDCLIREVNPQHRYLGIASIKNFFFFFDNAKIQVKFVGSYLKQDENILTVYEINLWPFKYSSDFMLKSCFFGAVKLTKMLILISINILAMVLDLI